MKFEVLFLAAAVLLPLAVSADVRVDINGVKDGVKIKKTAAEGFTGGNASWLPKEQQEQRIFLQKKLSPEYQEVAFTFTPDKDGSVWITFGGNWSKEVADRPFVLVDEITVNGEPLPNGGFESGLDTWSKGKETSVSPDAKEGKNAARVSHDNPVGRWVKVENGKNYEVKFFAKEAK